MKQQYVIYFKDDDNIKQYLIIDNYYRTATKTENLDDATKFIDNETNIPYMIERLYNYVNLEIEYLNKP